MKSKTKSKPDRKPVVVRPEIMEFEGRIIEVYKKKSGLYTLLVHQTFRDVDQEEMNRIIKKKEK